jgi:hypothetical protein
MRSKSRFTTLVLLKTRESYLQIRVQSQDTRTLSTGSKCILRSAASLNRPIAFSGGYHSSCLGARNVRLGSKRRFDRLPFTSGLPHQRTLSGPSECRKRAKLHIAVLFCEHQRGATAGDEDEYLAFRFNGYSGIGVRPR